MKASRELDLSSIYIIWHDAYAQWQVLTDNRRRTQDDCDFEGWGATIPEAFANRKDKEARSNDT